MTLTPSSLAHAAGGRSRVSAFAPLSRVAEEGLGVRTNNSFLSDPARGNEQNPQLAA